MMRGDVGPPLRRVHPEAVRVSFVTTWDPNDVSKGSGLPYYIARGLRSHDVFLSHVVLPENPFPSMLLGKTTQAFYRYLLHRNFDRLRNPILARQWASKLARLLCDEQTDLIFSTTSIPFAYLECRRPLVIWTDATFAGLTDFYPHLSGLPDWNVTTGHRLERAALERASLVIYSSEWAAATAVECYGISPSKIEVVPFGANLDEPVSQHDVAHMIAARPRSRCNLVFVGVDSYRKGTDVAIDVARRLNDLGMPTDLTIVGARKVQTSEPFIRATGFITKDDAGSRLIKDLFAAAHFALLPSRADCTPHAVGEANAFGVPVLTTNVGGIPTLMRQGVNGKMFDADVSPSDYASFIVDLLGDRARYEQLAWSSRREFETKLNWDVACNKVSDLLSTIA
jgi:glycosyltransferase involved in cell wall biosynthesis